MCGINLIIDQTLSLNDSVIQQMNAAINHRGPDHQDWKQVRLNDEQFFLGNARLQILDQHQRSHQPMSSKDGNFILTFNGEIYNYRTLKAELIDLGYSFNTESDTEVLLNWLIAFGVKRIDELNGMFAFAFLNAKNGALIIARDRHGMKPLYFTQTSSHVVFSSEIKGVLASNLVSKELNDQQIDHYLAFKYAKAPDTFFKDIQSVKPGHIITIERNELNESSFVKAPPQSESFGEDFSDNVENCLTKSLEQQLVADTEVGLFLSGGVDSTLLLALSKELGEKSMPTFSIAHDKSTGSYGTQDSFFAKKAAKMFGSDHYEFKVQPSVLADLESHLTNMDQPIGDSASILTSLLCKKASTQVKCVLSGAGADEWFAGYNRHQAYFHYLTNPAIQSNPKILKRFAHLLPTGIDHPLRKRFQLAKKFLDRLDKDPKKTYFNFLQFPDFRLAYESGSSEDTDLFRWALEHDRENYLVEDVLMLNDHWSMQHSMEMRMPYLDNKLTDLIKTISQEQVLVHGKKWILKSILTKLGGRDFADRPKEGFGLPTGKWLQNGHFSEQLHFLNDPQSIIFKYIDQKHTKHLVESHERKKRDYSLEFWSIMVLANWLEIHFK